MAEIARQESGKHAIPRDARSITFEKLDGRAWLVWLATLATVALLTRNPFYQGLLVFWILLSWTEKPTRQVTLGLHAVVWLGVVAVAFGAFFNALTVHIGSTVLFTLPGKIPLLSGIVTLEALAFGASSGFTLALLLLIFARFSAAVDYASLLRVVPHRFFELGLVISISLTLVPSLLRSWHNIRQAQALRGHQVRGLRDLLPLVVPLIVSGLERALTLAEAMEARGYARRGERQPLSYTFGRSLPLILLLLLLLGDVFFGFSRVMLVAGFVLCAILFWLSRHWQPTIPLRTSYRIQNWTWRETLVSAGALLMLVAFVLATPDTLNFSPYPRLSLPAFDPWLAVATSATALPALFVVPTTNPHDRD